MRRAVLTLATVLLVVFALTQLLPQDAAQVLAGQHADPARIGQLRAELGLDRPVWQRFGAWLYGLVRGDLGKSFVDGQPVGPLVWQRFGASLLVVGPAWTLAVGIGAVLALGRAGPAVVATVSGLPDVVVATGLVLVFATGLGLLPAVSLLPVGGSAWDRPAVLVLPVLALALPAAAWVARQLRGPVADVGDRPFVVDARLRGLSPARIAVRHVLPHLAAPLAQVAAILAGGLLSSGAVVESLFAYPGLGQLLATAVGTRDIPVIQAVALLNAVVLFFAVLIADRIAVAGAR